jgi:MFS family permease
VTITREVSEVEDPADARATRMSSRDHADIRRFVLAFVGFALLFTAVGRIYGEDIAMWLLDTPTTTLGWHFIGWLVSAPPAVLTMITWHERRRLRPEQRRDRSLLLAGWFGLSMFILPARTASVDSQFGTGALVGDPLSAGWAWGALAAVIGVVFTGLVLIVLFRTVEVPTRAQRDLTVRFLERAWLVLLVVSLGFALYGARTDVFHGGS